jgi:hypothetical protein
MKSYVPFLIFLQFLFFLKKKNYALSYTNLQKKKKKKKSLIDCSTKRTQVSPDLRLWVFSILLLITHQEIDNCKTWGHRFSFRGDTDEKNASKRKTLLSCPTSRYVIPLSQEN